MSLDDSGLQGLDDHRLDLRVGDRPRPARPRLIHQTIQPVGRELRHLVTVERVTLTRSAIPVFVAGHVGEVAGKQSAYGSRRAVRAGSRAGDDVLLREGLASLRQRSGFEVVGHPDGWTRTTDSREAARACAHPGTRLSAEILAGGFVRPTIRNRRQPGDTS